MPSARIGKRIGDRVGYALGRALLGGQGAAPSVTSSPSATQTAIIGVENVGSRGTWSGSPDSYEDQWERVGVGDISGATSINYTPVDADWGYQLRHAVRAHNAAGWSEWVYSDPTDRVADVPVLDRGGDYVTNGTFDSDTGWSKGAGWAIGSGKATRDGTAATSFLSQNAGLTNVAVHELSMSVLRVDAGSVQFVPGGYENGETFSVVGNTLELIQQVNTSNSNLFVQGLSAFNGDIDNIVGVIVTPSAQLTAPSANMQPLLYYTLPGSPKHGTQVWLQARISSAGNGWLALLVYTGSQWNITLYSVVSYSRTSRISATNIGATDGIYVNMNGDSISLYTTADGGDNWTQRGSTIANSLYNTATGVNAIWTSDIDADLLEYAPAA